MRHLFIIQFQYFTGVFDIEPEGKCNVPKHFPAGKQESRPIEVRVAKLQ